MSDDRWEIRIVGDGDSCKALLDQGWEPFALTPERDVATSWPTWRVWLRRRVGPAAEYATRQQPAPTGDGPSVTDWLVEQLTLSGLPGTAPLIEDLLARREAGRAVYGDELRAGNGRDAGVDAYQELLDAGVYLAQLVLEGRLTGGENMLAGVLAFAGRLRQALDERDRAVGDT